MGILWTLIIAIVLTLIITVIYSFVKTIMDVTHPEKKITLKTELPYFKEADMNDTQIDKGIPEIQSVSMLYEEMCIINPLAYENDPTIDNVIKNYKDIILGRTLDPSGFNMPSEFINGERNPDYRRYIYNQRRKLKANAYTLNWINEEYKRINEAGNYTKVREKFIGSLIEFGIPETLVYFVATDDRIETYSPKDWDNLKNAIKSYLCNWSEEQVREYISLFEGDKLLDDISAEKYFMLRDHGVESDIAKLTIDGDIDDKQLYHIIYLVENKAYSSIDAITKVFEDSNMSLKEELLRNKYKKKMEGRR